MPPSQPRDGLAATFVLAFACAAAYAIALPHPGFFDNEGRYVEVARQMNARADFVTPFMNGVPFLNKPPLTFWLIAGLLRWVDPFEWARLLSVAAALATIVATVRLTTHRCGVAHGLMAGVLLATATGFVLEARTLRPDGLLVAAVTWAMLCLWNAEHVPGGRTRWLVGFYVSLGVGMLAKGFVPFLLIGPPVALVMVGRFAQLRPALGAVVVGSIVLPWYVAAAWRNPGFAWDFVVNQHLLFAFGRKEPRDSVGDSLRGFAGAFLGRAAPWIALVPLARREGHPWGLVPWVWMLAPLVLFSLTPSRLEHYLLPALPPVAMLAAGPALDIARAARPSVCVVTGALAALAMAAGAVLVVAGPSLLAPVYWIAQAPALTPLPRLAGGVLLGGGTAMGAAVLARRGRVALGAFVATAIAFDAIVVSALGIVTPLFSWRPVAAVIEERVGPAAEVVFEAPVEYQLVGGLDFYLGREVTLLEPAAGFGPPTYLEAYVGGMFVRRGEFERRWRGERAVVLVSDPTRRRDTPAGVAPDPFVVLARFGDRWVLGNHATAR